MEKFGYIRVSTKEQNPDRQIITMRNVGIDERDILIEKVSGRNFKRPKYELLKQLVREGDTVVFDSLTRMARNMNETLKEYEWFVNKGVQLDFIKGPMLSASEQKDDIIAQAIQRVVLTMLAAYAEKELLDNKIRQAEGIAAARLKGKHLGRPKVEDTPEFLEAYSKWSKGEISAVEAISLSGLSKSTFYRKAKEQ